MARTAKPHTGIYMIKNTRNGRFYIGSAIRFNKRWKEHLRGLEFGKHHSRFLQRDWDKCGAGSFEFKILMYCGREELIAYEQRCIDILKPVYNCAPVAGSQLGFKMSDESKAKMSAAAKRNKNFSGHLHSEETKAKIRAAKLGHKYGKYSKQRVEKVASAMRAGKNALSEQEVRTIRELKRQGLTAVRIAKRIGRKVYPVYDVLQRKTFKWVL